MLDIQTYQQLKNIYTDLNIPGFENNKEIFKNYLQSQKKIKTYSYKIEKELQQKIYHQLKEAIDYWEYTI